MNFSQSSKACAPRRALLGITLSIVAGSITSAAVAQSTDPLPQILSHNMAVGTDSGLVRASAAGQTPEVVYTTSVRSAGAAWLRLSFSDVTLAGDPAADGAMLRITSQADGAVQYLNAEQLAQWANSSAYFNGEAVTVELLAFPGTGDSRVVIDQAAVGDAAQYAARTICGATDDRTLSSDRVNARLLPAGCTGFIIGDPNRSMLTAGHCGVSSTTVVEFNVPMSGTDGTLMHPSPSDQYAVDPASIQASDNGLGNDWTYFGCFPNSNTRMTPVQAQGQWYNLALHAPAPAGQTLRVTGYGTVSAPVSLTWQEVQKTATGPYTGQSGMILSYAVDTTGGNSGGAIVNLANGTVIGIHTNAGCTSTGGANQGTAIECTGLQTALANPRGVCASGVIPGGASSGRQNVYIADDTNNKFGSLATGSGAFTAIATTPPSMQGLAYDRNSDRFLGMDSSRNLYTINPTTGQTILMGTVVGTSQVLSGLGYDPDAGLLYAIAQANGQLYVINPSVRVAQLVGPPQGGNMGGLDFDRFTHTLYGIDDAPTGSRLIRVSTTTGAWTVVGNLGAGATDCNGLAFNPYDHLLYTVNAPTGQMLSISPTTGAATIIGPTNGVFGSSFGMAARELPGTCSADFNNDGDSATDQDIQDFFQTLAGHPCPTCGSADFNGDGDSATDADIESFFRVLAGGPC
jgi:V8-like Glu-specific endopeptidase